MQYFRFRIGVTIQIPFPKHNVHMQCHGNYIEVKIFNFVLEIAIFRKSSQIFWGFLKSDFGGFGCP